MTSDCLAVQEVFYFEESSLPEVSLLLLWSRRNLSFFAILNPGEGSRRGPVGNVVGPCKAMPLT